MFGVRWPPYKEVRGGGGGFLKGVGRDEDGDRVDGCDRCWAGQGRESGG